MPVIFREGGLRYFFFSNEGSPREAPHIHVKGGGRDAKVWLEPEPIIAESYGFNSRELARILRVIMDRRDLILRAWHEHFGDGSSL
jgi:Domain of unknown function (DUF4160)